MKQVTINIPDNKYGFFVELLKSISFVDKFNEEEILVSAQEKKIIRQRIKTAKPHNFKKWKDIKKKSKTTLADLTAVSLKEMSSLSEEKFSTIWDNESDAVYDRFLK